MSIASPPASTTLPQVIVIGAMKAGTSAVHAYLDAHPDIAMSEPKELNFFNGRHTPPHRATDQTWGSGNWHRGVDWYAAQFSSVAPVRGEASPAYTSPSFPEVAGRMASIVPDARLVYLVRDPLDRALSQYAHHRGEGTEARPVEEALLDPASQYVARSRFAERLTPFLDHFGRSKIHVVVQERLLHRRSTEIGRLYDHVGVDPEWRDPRHSVRFHVGDGHPTSSDWLSQEFRARVSDDTERLRSLLGDPIPEWDDRR